MSFRLLTFLFLFSVGVMTNAGIKNPNLRPVGHVEGLLGNAGVALRGGAGNAFFNPAGLDEAEGLRFTLSAQSALISDIDFVIAQSDAETSLIEVDVDPQFSFSFGTGKWAFSLFQLSNTGPAVTAELSEDIAGATRSSALDLREESLVIGLASKYSVLSNVSLGLSVLFERMETVSNIDIRQVDGTAVSDFLVSDRLNRRAHVIYPVFGVMADWTDSWSSGLRVQLPGVFVQGDATNFNAQKGTKKSQSIDDKSSNTFSVQQKTPIDFVFGNSVWLGKHGLFLDLGFQLPTDFIAVLDEVNSGSENRTIRFVSKATARFHLGYRYQWNETWSGVFGFQLNPSTLESDVSDLEVGHELDKNAGDFWSASLGVSHRRGPMEIALGGFYSQSDTVISHTLDSGNETTYEAALRLGGIYLSTRFFY